MLWAGGASALSSMMAVWMWMGQGFAGLDVFGGHLAGNIDEKMLELGREGKERDEEICGGIYAT